MPPRPGRPIGPVRSEDGNLRCRPIMPPVSAEAPVHARQETPPTGFPAHSAEVVAPPWALPFHGRARSYQLLGTGSLKAATALTHPFAFGPLAFDDQRALIQLSFMDWRETPVGPTCASFVGIVVGTTPPGQIQPERSRAPAAAAVLAAFVKAPRVLSAPTYVVGDAPDGPRGCGARSREYGRSGAGHRQDGRHVPGRCGSGCAALAVSCSRPRRLPTL